MPESIVVGFSLTKKDRDIAAWLNMLTEKKLSPATWVQAVVLSEICGKELDIGSVYVPDKTNRPSTLMFGDDTEEEEEEKVKYNWATRGKNGEYVVGSVFTMKVTQPIMIYIFETVLNHRKKLGSFIKVMIRKHLRKTSRPMSEPPKNADNINDIFILYENLVKGYRTPSRKSPAQKQKTSEPKKEISPNPPPQKPVDIPEPPKKTKNPMLQYI